ncbi:hypothetical protein [uncultured Fretibacterium sp.]|uniref:hypothetical protein n=1 Tax=uncultured Fretibacterium sp. TaxID=1678694 RepID=UPI0026325562|nr:hypothetical protein [uncultured Fretibacterium sp.]
MGYNAGGEVQSRVWRRERTMGTEELEGRPAGEPGSGTIFDDVFRTMLQKLPRLVPAVLNEVFGTDYGPDERMEQFRNEQIGPGGRTVTDSVLQVRDRTYHVECQSTPDGTMAVRMIEYDFRIALDGALRAGGSCEMSFPHSCVLYLRHGRTTPEELKVKVNLPDGGVFWYRTPVVKVQEYTREKIFEKRLLFFLPYYVMRYEKQFCRIEEDEGRLAELRQEFEAILRGLVQDEDEELSRADLMELIMRVVDHMLGTESRIRREVHEVMGGQVLELYSERLMREGQELGRTEGRELGRAEGRAEERAKMESILVHVKDEGRDLGRAEVVRQLCASGLLTPEQIAGVVGMTPEEVRALQKR